MMDDGIHGESMDVIIDEASVHFGARLESLVFIRNHTKRPVVVLGVEWAGSRLPSGDRFVEGAPTSRHGIGFRGGRRSLSMGCVKEDDGDIEKALAFHRVRCQVQEDLAACVRGRMMGTW